MIETVTMDQQEQIASLARAEKGTRTIVTEQNRLAVEAPQAYARCFARAVELVVTAMTAGAALFGAGAAFAKLLAP
ncbi:conserved protein of unknown function [Bradyrhizobium sp. ORS 285]|uniref:hypothetical protein n=1 Tax=Bradyrhizobium sp. ORS 285 TaxID=115808 RepID=UPI000240788F|nr:hypothetical protein [Bradyrhizobium sp. ORS 285]CCD85587.1 conserved hypothetical protein [Bradyrhizobium sp. ORS 285]SMX56446.1 conserved protein of unknown function [Bradyrhizobium sp. ORS 285]